MYCGSGEVRGVHADMFTALEEVARKARGEDALQHTFMGAVITEIRRIVATNAAQAPGFVPSRAKPMLGLWPPEQIQDIMHSLPDPQRTYVLGQAAISKLRSSLVTIHKITMQHVFKAWSIRKRRHPHASTAPHQHRQRRLQGTRAPSHHSLPYALHAHASHTSSPMGSPVSSVSSVCTDLDYEDDDDTAPIHDFLHAHPVEGVG